MILFPDSLEQTQRPFVEEIEEGEVDMTVEIGIEAEVYAADHQYERTYYGEVDAAETAQHTVGPRLPEDGKDKCQHRGEQQYVTDYLHVEAQDIEKKMREYRQVAADNLQRNERNGKAAAHGKQDDKQQDSMPGQVF